MNKSEIEHALSLLRGAVLNASIFPPGSQIIKTPAEAAQRAFEGCFRDMDSIVVNDIKGKLCINQDVEIHVPGFLNLLQQQGIQSLEFRQGMTLDELARLAVGLGKKKEDLGAPDFGSWLQTQGLTHVVAEEIQYVAVRKGEEVTHRVQLLTGKEYETFSPILSAVEDSLRLLESMPDPAKRQALRDEMVNQLVNLSPFVLRQLLAGKSSDAMADDLRQQVVASLSQEKVEQTLAETENFYRQLQNDNGPEVANTPETADLKAFVKMLLNSPGGQTVSQELVRKLRALGLLPAMPHTNMVPGQYPSRKYVEHLVSLPHASLLSPDLSRQLPELLQNLCAMNAEGLSDQLTHKVLENLQDADAVTRAATVKVLRLFQDVLAANRQMKPLTLVVTALSERAEVENEAPVYSEIVDSLQKAAMDCLVNRQFSECAAILKRIRRHGFEGSPETLIKKNPALKTLQEFARRAIEVLCADLLCPDKERQLGGAEVLAELGEEAVEPLLTVLQRSGEARTRQFAIETLKRFAPRAKDLLLQQLNVRTPAPSLLRLLPLCADFDDRDFYPTFLELLHHPEGIVRRESARALSLIKNAPSRDYVLRLLDDPDPSVQIEGVRQVRNVRTINAVQELLKRLFSFSTGVQEEVCPVLADSRDPRAVPALLDLLHRPTFFWQHQKKSPDSVRVRAVLALQQFLPDPDIEKIIRKATKDANRVVAAAAHSTLEHH